MLLLSCRLWAVSMLDYGHAGWVMGLKHDHAAPGPVTASAHADVTLHRATVAAEASLWRPTAGCWLLLLYTLPLLPLWPPQWRHCGLLKLKCSLQARIALHQSRPLKSTHPLVGVEVGGQPVVVLLNDDLHQGGKRVREAKV